MLKAPRDFSIHPDDDRMNDWRSNLATAQWIE